jgi:hypothetical protein
MSKRKQLIISAAENTYAVEILNIHYSTRNLCQLHLITQSNETLFPNWQKELRQTFEETSGYVRPERVNKWPDSMTDM